MLTGQLSAAVALDLLTPATRSHIGVQVILGILVTLVAAGWRGRRPPRGRAPAGSEVLRVVAAARLVGVWPKPAVGR